MKKTLYFLLFTLSVIALAGCSGNKQPAQEPVATEEPSSEIPTIEEPTPEPVKANYSTVIPFGDNIDTSLDPSERKGLVCIVIEEETAARGSYNNDSVIGICKLLEFNIFQQEDYTVISTDDLSLDSCDTIVKEFSEKGVTTFIFDIGGLGDFKETRDKLAQRYSDKTILPKIVSEEEHNAEELAEVQSEILGDWSFYAAGNRMHIDASTLTITIFSTGPGGKILQEDTYNYVIEKNPEDVRARYDIRATESNANGYTPEFFFLATDPGHLYGFPSPGGEGMIVYYKDN